MTEAELWELTDAERFALIADKVMGWTEIELDTVRGAGFPPFDAYFGRPPDSDGWTEMLDDYDTEWMRIVERMREQGWVWEIEDMVTQWWVRLGSVDYANVGGKHKDLGKAVQLAALRVAGAVE